MLISTPDDEEVRHLTEDGYTAVLHIARERAVLDGLLVHIDGLLVHIDGLLVRIDGALVPVADLARPAER
jgi:hypothetical protein